MNAIGGFVWLKSINKSKENWERARQMAEKEGALEEFEKKKANWNNYMFDEMYG